MENGQLVVLTFCFQFPPPKIQAIKNLNLTKQFMCSKLRRFKELKILSSLTPIIPQPSLF